MSKKLILIVLFILLAFGLFSQRSTIELNFTAENNGFYVKLDSIKIINRTQGGETMIYWPDTIASVEINQGDLLLYVGYATFFITGVQEVDKEVSSFEVHQNHPNPMGDRSEISMYVPHTGLVQMVITDLQGRIVYRTERQLDGGHHAFRFQPGAGHVYFFTAMWNGASRSVRMLASGQQAGGSCRLDYVGNQTGEPALKNSLQVNDLIVRQSGILDSLVEEKTYTFRFATNIPCPGTPTVEYEGQTYHTIQIFSQCWLKENLNVGEMIDATILQSDNGIVEKYCYYDDSNRCLQYGGLYQWWEMMQYTTQQGARGICPPGWHVPTDEDWKVLSGAVDSQFGIGDSHWDGYGYTGFDAATNLKSTSGWYLNGNGTDLYGFKGLPGGGRYHPGYFGHIGELGRFYTSTEGDYLSAFFRDLCFYYPDFYRFEYHKENGFSVRCLRD